LESLYQLYAQFPSLLTRFSISRIYREYVTERGIRARREYPLGAACVWRAVRAGTRHSRRGQGEP